MLLIISNKLKEVSDTSIVLLAEGTNAQAMAVGRLRVPENRRSNEHSAFSNAGCSSIPASFEQASFIPAPLKKEDVLRSFLFNHSQSEDSGPRENHAKGHDFDLMMDMEKLKKEYDVLSRTFKNMIDYLASCIAATTTLVHQLDRNKKLLIEKSKTSYA